MASIAGSVHAAFPATLVPILVVWQEVSNFIVTVQMGLFSVYSLPL